MPHDRFRGTRIERALLDALVFFTADGPMRLTYDDLVHFAGVSYSSVSKALSDLIARGYVDRCGAAPRNPERQLKATPEGIAYWRETYPVENEAAQWWPRTNGKSTKAD